MEKPEEMSGGKKEMASERTFCETCTMAFTDNEH